MRLQRMWRSRELHLLWKRMLLDDPPLTYISHPNHDGPSSPLFSLRNNLRTKQGHTLMLSLIMLLLQVFSLTSNFVCSAWFFAIILSIHFVSSCARSSGFGRGIPSMLLVCSYAVKSAWYKVGSRNWWMCCTQSWKASVAIEGQMLIMHWLH